MNGLQGVLGPGPNAKGRWPVQLATGKNVAVKEENIRVVDAPAAATAVVDAHQKLIETCLAAFCRSCADAAAGGPAGEAATVVKDGGDYCDAETQVALEVLCNATHSLPALACPPAIAISLIDAVVSSLASSQSRPGGGGGSNAPPSTSPHAMLWLKICSRNRPLAQHLTLPMPFRELMRAATTLRPDGALPPLPAKTRGLPAAATTSLSPESAIEAIKCTVNVLLQCPAEACQAAIKVDAISLLLNAALASPATFWGEGGGLLFYTCRGGLHLHTSPALFIALVLARASSLCVSSLPSPPPLALSR